MKQYQNNEGYTDYTAYKAIQNVEREENKMSEVVNIYRGDIWEIQRGNFYVNVLVVSSDERSGDNILSTVELKNVQYNNSAKVVCDGIMYANCNAVTFHTKDKFCRFLRTATVEEMKAVDDMLCSALGIERTTGTTGITDVLNAECEKLKERNENQRETIENLMAENQLLRDKNKEVAKYEKESDLYKDLYEFALGKLMTER